MIVQRQRPSTWDKTMTEARGADSYFYDRAAFELHMAQKAQAPEAVLVHYQLANLYLDRYYGASDARRATVASGEMRMTGPTI